MSALHDLPAHALLSACYAFHRARGLPDLPWGDVIPGLVACAVAGHHSAYPGFADLATKKPLRPDAIYRIYSMSKPVTGVAVMIPLEEGRFRLDDPVSLYLPSFQGLRLLAAEHGAAAATAAPAREVTISQL